MFNNNYPGWKQSYEYTRDQVAVQFGISLQEWDNMPEDYQIRYLAQAEGQAAKAAHEQEYYKRERERNKPKGGKSRKFKSR